MQPYCQGTKNPIFNSKKYLTERFISLSEAQSLSRSGRPKKHSAYDERHILRIIRQNPKITYQQFQEDLNLDISRATDSVRYPAATRRNA